MPNPENALRRVLFAFCSSAFCGSLALLLLMPTSARAQAAPDWSLHALPASVRLDPVEGTIIEDRPDIYRMRPMGDLLGENWVYDGERVAVHAARGEYVSFQLVITRPPDATLENIIVEMDPLTQRGDSLGPPPELFLEWAVEVKSKSDGYPKSSLGPGWYPDALIPLEFIQMDTSKATGRVTYPLQLPDFNNRMEEQRHLILWVDQYVPQERRAARPGDYESQVTVTVEGQTKTLPVRLKVWDFAIPNENTLANNLQMSGFLSGMEDEALELATYQLFKRNRVGLTDPSYAPQLAVSDSGAVRLDWSDFDRRLEKYFSGAAFTEQYGYAYGPGYGEPIKNFVLPFDVYGKHGTPGWPDIGKPDVERKPARRAIYVGAIEQVRAHLLDLADPEDTRLIAYLNGLDESYFPEAWDRMVYYGDLFETYFPESSFRVDGGYSEEAMEVIGESIDLWASHTINYNMDKIRASRARGVDDWVYGPLVYESAVNSWVGSSTFMDLPLINDRALSWAVWKYRTPSWIQWGIGSRWKQAWYDPSTWKDLTKDVKGNALLAYSPGIIPRVNTPCPSIRLKAMREGVEEYAFMQLLSKLDGTTERADAIVNELVHAPWGDASIGNINVWDYNARRYDQGRIELGNLIESTLRAQKEGTR